MIAKGTNCWNFNTLLGDNEGEIALSPDDITVFPLYKDDYQFTTDEIRREQESIHRIGMTERLVVERTANGYSLIGPLLPYQALLEDGISELPCIVRIGDLPQVQQVLSIRLNAEYSRLSPLVYSRLITRLGRLFPVMKAVSGMNLGIKREWIAGILGISSSAVLRYSYISKVPEALQQRCNNPDFPYLCYKDTIHFTESQYRQLLEELIHYELRSRYIQISASELTEMIRHIAVDTDDSVPVDHKNVITDENITTNGIEKPSTKSVNKAFSSNFTTAMPALYEPLTEAYYQNLISAYEDQFDEDVEEGTSSEMMRIAHKDGYFVPDQALREASYLLYSLSRMRLAGGQRLLDYACLRSIQESVEQLYSQID